MDYYRDCLSTSPFDKTSYYSIEVGIAKHFYYGNVEVIGEQKTGEVWSQIIEQMKARLN